MADTNRKFARAQQIAHIGSWENHLATSTLTWSEEMHRILGFPTDVPFKLEEVTGVFPPAELEKFNKCISEAISTRSPYSQDYRIIRPDGETRYIHDEGEVTFNENGQPEIFFGTTQDITERKLNELELISTKELAEESNRLKSAFLNNMSHEIRTPINAIMGFSDLLSNAEEEERKRYSEIIRRSSQQLLSVIDDVIQVSRLQSEKIPVNPVVFSPVELITSVAQMFNLPELLNGLHLKINIPAKHHHLTIISDKDKIQQVLSNLISNAIKYTKNGSVDIGFVFQGNSIEFFVEDTGIGIPENERARVFEKFFRGEGVISAAIGGTGLGLNIAKELVELLGGTIGVSSEYNKGSRFYFSVPVEQFRETTVEKRSLSSGSTNLSNLIILIVEDNFENYLLLEIILRNLVKRIDHAWNGKEALDLAAENRYDLVLMDLKMPVMGGFEATIELRKLYPDIPVIAQTAYAQPEEREGAFKAGCDDYISKPVKKELLLEIMGKCSRK
jgi:PAS domain S-box-containing protein